MLRLMECQYMKIITLAACCVVMFCSPKPPSLPNWGNSCYMNAVVQCLYNVVPLSNFVAGKDYVPREQLLQGYQQLVRAIKNKGDLSEKDSELKDFYSSVGARLNYPAVFEDVRKWGVKTIQPELLKKKINAKIVQLRKEKKSKGYISALETWKKKVDGNAKEVMFHADVESSFIKSLPLTCKQQDSAEVVRVFSRIAEKDLLRFNDLFSLKYISGIFCNNNLSADKSPGAAFSILLSLAANTKRTLYDLLHQQEDVPGGFKVEGGIKKEDCVKDTRYISLSEYLLIDLLRYEIRYEFETIDGVEQMREVKSKISDDVEVPLILDMQKFMAYPEQHSIKDEVLVYELIGFTSHSGSLDSGHWVAYVKDEAENQWYYCSDSDITTVTEKEAEEEARQGSLFFYKRLPSQKQHQALIAQEKLNNFGRSLNAVTQAGTRAP